MAASTPKDEVVAQPQQVDPAGKKAKDTKEDQAAKDAAGKKYVVKGRLKHNGDIYQVDSSITLSDEHAAPLLDAGVIVGA